MAALDAIEAATLAASFAFDAVVAAEFTSSIALFKAAFCAYAEESSNAFAAEESACAFELAVEAVTAALEALSADAFASAVCLPASLAA